MINPNLQILEIMVKSLNGLSDQLVFIGGATVGLYITDKAVQNVRHTFDIDCVVEVLTLKEYYDIAEKLKQIGFKEDTNSGVICRYRKNELILDLMPAKAENILGFTNSWYEEGIKNKIPQILPSGKKISTFSVPYFIASKIEAFKSRGKGDFLGSHDLEDIITVFDGDPKISENILASPQTVYSYLKTELTELLQNDDFISSIEGHISDRLNTAQRSAIVLNRIRASFRNTSE